MIYNDDTTWYEYIQYTLYINHLSLGNQVTRCIERSIEHRHRGWGVELKKCVLDTRRWKMEETFETRLGLWFSVPYCWHHSGLASFQSWISKGLKRISWYYRSSHFKAPTSLVSLIYFDIIAIHIMKWWTQNGWLLTGLNSYCPQETPHWFFHQISATKIWDFEIYYFSIF